MTALSPKAADRLLGRGRAKVVLATLSIVLSVAFTALLLGLFLTEERLALLLLLLAVAILESLVYSSWRKAVGANELFPDERLYTVPDLLDPDVHQAVNYPTREALQLRSLSHIVEFLGAFAAILAWPNVALSLAGAFVALFADELEEKLELLVPRWFYRTPVSDEVRRQWIRVDLAWGGVGFFVLVAVAIVEFA